MTSYTLAAKPGSFQHAYTLAQPQITNVTRQANLMQRPYTRQLNDPNTGLLSTEWQGKLAQLIDNINLLLQNQAQR
jgi:hypothetical protein